MTNEQLIVDAKSVNATELYDDLTAFEFNEVSAYRLTQNQLIAFADIIRKRHEHIRTDNGAVIVKLQADLDKANAEIARLCKNITYLEKKIYILNRGKEAQGEQNE